MPKQPNWLVELRKFSIRKASQLREKSNQLFEDAQFLCEAERWSTFVYLGGIVIERLLKAELWPRRHGPRIARLIYSSHDLAEMLEACPQLQRELERPTKVRVDRCFRGLCDGGVRVRYNPKKPSAEDGNQYRVWLRELRAWLIGRN